MPNFRRATVVELISERPGLQRVRLEGGDRAYALTQLIGPVEVGDDVIVNTTAVELGLGTGGWHVVHWNLRRDEWGEPGPGHIMKLRYTSLQVDTGSSTEDRDLDDVELNGTPVVVCGLHSQVGVVATVAEHLRPGTRIAYVMTDGAALPLALSDLVAELVDGGVIDLTITAGHAFGGDLEAVSVPSALVLAAAEAADLVVVGMGPGVVGTASRLGNTAVEVAAICDTVDALGGRAVLCLRASSGDERARHQGISHHSRTALDLVRTEPLRFLPSDVDAADLDAVGVEVPDVQAVLDAHGVRITTMGRPPAEDPLFFTAAAAAAVGAVGLLAGSGQ